MEEGLIFGLNKWGEFGQIRYQAELNSGEKRRISLNVPRGRWWLVFRYRFGDITADVIKKLMKADLLHSCLHGEDACLRFQEEMIEGCL